MSATPAEAPVIEVIGLSKRYFRQEYRASLRHEALSLVRRALSRRRERRAQPFLALRDVSFRVRRGEALAIVGRNGSGKTTLLRLLAGIATPTSGSVAVRGRHAALIGLNAGFLTELSGRKNIYLNAAMYGVPPRGVDAIVEAIIDFAEIRPSIDTPVKHYSSGMAARLGFSIAVHVLPEIIFIDEALAVGDLAFQEKCMARMQELKAEGRTLVFVSHAPATVQELCERALWLDAGVLKLDGPTGEVLAAYLAALHGG